MSLSVARPIVTEPAGLADGDDRGDEPFDESGREVLRVARTDVAHGGLGGRDVVQRRRGPGVDDGELVRRRSGRRLAGSARWSDTPTATAAAGRAERSGGAGRVPAWGAAPAGRSHAASPRPAQADAAVDHDMVDCRTGRSSAPGWLAAFPAARPDLERQSRAAGIADVDALPVVDVDHRSAIAVDESPVHRAVVDGDPLALLEAQDQVRAGDPGIGDPDVSTQITPDDDVLTWREGTFRTVVPNGQQGRGWSTHRSSIDAASAELPTWRTVIRLCLAANCDQPRFIASFISGTAGDHRVGRHDCEQ